MDRLVSSYFEKHNIKYAEVSIEILELLTLKHLKFDTAEKIQQLLDSKFDHLLERTFGERIVFWYTEVITEEILKIIHEYFRSKCCNIQNIIFLTSTSGLKEYYQKYCSIERSHGMQVFELPLNHLDEYYTGISTKSINKNIKKMFSFYGGTYDLDPPERTFLTLFASQFSDVASVEIFSKCKEKQLLENWLERETFFLDAKFVETYLNLYDKHIDKDLNFNPLLSIIASMDKEKNEKFGQGNYQEFVDAQCLFSLVRETNNFESFSFISEKTFRCFYNHLIPIPIGGSTIIDDLIDCGYWIDKSFFDYSYLEKTLFKDKINALYKSIDSIAKLNSNTLREYYYDNFKNFDSNQQLLVNWPYEIEKRLKIEFGY